MTVPVSGQAYTFFVSLVSLVDGRDFVVDPDIAPGDFQVSTDGSALAALAGPPIVSPTGSVLVAVSLTASEMNGSKINVVGSDIAGGQWEDLSIMIDTPAASVETVFDVLDGDHVESSTNLTINKKNTLDPLIQKDISGSLLSPSVTIRTIES